jgi:hypothetical protein
VLPRYSIYGGCLASEVPLPELSPLTHGSADWTLRLGSVGRERSVAVTIGARQRRDCRVEIARAASAFRVRHSCVGEYDVSPDSGEIVCYPAVAATPLAIKNDLVGRVLPLVLHLRGALCLHASAVIVNGRAICFIRAGATLGSDDVVLLEERRGDVHLRPGVDSVRLCPDATQQLASHGAWYRSPLDGKDVIPLRSAKSAWSEVPLAALYFMAPGNGTPAVRRRVPPQAASLLLVRHARLGRVLGGIHAGLVLQRAAAVARAVPSYALHVVSDLARIQAVAEHILRWESSPASGATGTHG